MSRPLTGSGTASSAARTTGRPRNASHRSSVSKSTSNTTPHLSACHVPSRTPLVSAASMRAESCCSCHRKAETSPCRTSIDHHSATIAMVRLRPRTATPAGPAQAATRRDPSRPPSPNGQPGNVSPKATRKLSTRTHARSIAGSAYPHPPCRLCVCLLMVRHQRPSGAEQPVLSPPLLRCNCFAFGALSGRAYRHSPNQDRRREIGRRQAGSVRQRVRRCHPHPRVVSGDSDS
jgi:hypothetical protein